MPTAHSTKIAAPTSSRAEIVARQLSGRGSLTVYSSALATPTPAVDRSGTTALDDNRGARLGHHELEPPDRERLDTLRAT